MSAWPWYSTIAQHDDRQRIALEEFGITADHIFADKQSGKIFDRPAYNELMTRLSPQHERQRGSYLYPLQHFLGGLK